MHYSVEFLVLILSPNKGLGILIKTYLKPFICIISVVMPIQTFILKFFHFYDTITLAKAFSMRIRFFWNLFHLNRMILV